MFENIAVLPLYIGYLRHVDKLKGFKGDVQVGINTDYSKVYKSVFGAFREHESSNQYIVKGVIRHYHIKSDGTIVFLMETDVA